MFLTLKSQFYSTDELPPNETEPAVLVQHLGSQVVGVYAKWAELNKNLETWQHKLEDVAEVRRKTLYCCPKSCQGCLYFLK